jgi:mono/diheme cytochrome c family protein
MQGLSDEDLVAVVSYLRAPPPVRNPVPMHQYTTLGKVLKATLFSKPTGPRETPPVTNPRGPTVENGRYLVESVALCWACHTQRDMQTGQLTGPRFGGAKAFEVKDGKSWSPPNITTDPTTGKLAAMTEDEFITRFRAGRLLPGSPMPWQGLMHMDEDDLRAMYRYLKTVPAVNNDVGPPVMEVAK